MLGGLSTTRSDVQAGLYGEISIKRAQRNPKGARHQTLHSQTSDAPEINNVPPAAHHISGLRSPCVVSNVSTARKRVIFPVKVPGAIGRSHGHRFFTLPCRDHTPDSNSASNDRPQGMHEKKTHPGTPNLIRPLNRHGVDTKQRRVHSRRPTNSR